jgi:hypothetical protein
VFMDFVDRPVCLTVSRGNAVGTAAGYGLNDRGVELRVLVGSRMLSSPYRTDQLWSPPNLLCNRY